MKTSLFTVTTICTCLVAGAQEIDLKRDTITWEVEGLIDTKHNQSIGFVCTFVTYGLARIDWIQKDGDYVNEFEIVSSNDQWPDLSREGFIMYGVRYQKRDGKIWFGRVGDTTEVQMIFEEMNENSTPYSFRVKHFTR